MYSQYIVLDTDKHFKFDLDRKLNQISWPGYHMAK